MTNELEKTFFDTFGIKAKEYKACDSFPCGNQRAKCGNCKDYKLYKTEYPQITDRILLELIRIIGKKPFGYLQCENTYSTNLGDIRDIITVEADSLKEGLLTLAMQNKVVLRIKHQVRTLFEEG